MNKLETWENNKENDNIIYYKPCYLESEDVED